VECSFKTLSEKNVENESLGDVEGMEVGNVRVGSRCNREFIVVQRRLGDLARVQ
jgi:hypothetical protein